MGVIKTKGSKVPNCSILGPQSPYIASTLRPKSKYSLNYIASTLRPKSKYSLNPKPKTLNPKP